MNAQTCLLLLLGGLAACDATARLGETEEQSRRRYGEPLQPGDDHFRAQPVLKGAITRTYSYRGWWIRPAFVEGRTVRLTYTKIEGRGLNPAIQAEELDTLLKDEAGQGTWRKQTAAPEDAVPLQAGYSLQGTDFINTNGNHARLEVGHTVVTFETPAAPSLELRALAKERQAKANSPRR